MIYAGNQRVSELPLSWFPSLITGRALGIESILNKRDILIAPAIKTLFETENVNMGIEFIHNGVRYPIYGFEGMFSKRDLVVNRQIEYEAYVFYKCNDDIETEDVYSVERKETVKNIKHRVEDSIIK